ncbi:hypothetical protein OE88DRAFT_1361233 [Heliocybe sulcata]|uniref:Uncharacterized protein n=1 Tax=Heliocybe sulcata TaxID=5364 RepID=A0A5C3N4S7_9AGAM|nr:hypothetical protein OE88DRAFT_1361233 [Heliocybe sulcata]
MQFSYVFGPTGQPTLALWILSMVYGMFVVLFGTAVHLLRKSISSRSGDSTVEKSLLYVAVISFLLTTTAIGVCFVLVAYTYGVNMSRLEDMVVRAANPSQTYHKFMTASEQLQIITAVLLNLQIMVADAFLLWRCYVVWNKKAIVVKIVLPMVVVETVMGFVRLGWSAAPANFLEEGTLSPIEFYISMVYFASLLAINLTMSMLIAFRTFRAHRAMRHFPGLSLGRRYLWLTYLIVECGASYWLCIIIVIGVELGSSKVYSSLGEDLSSLSTPFVMIFLQIAATLGAVRCVHYVRPATVLIIHRQYSPLSS